MTISYCISVCTEAEELNKLLEQLSSFIDNDDEIVLLVDQDKCTSEVSQVITKWKALFKNFKLVGASLNNNFATFKNNFVENATKDYIFQIDADEILSDSFIAQSIPDDGFAVSQQLFDLKSILELNPQVDMYWISRENYVSGLTAEHVQKWGWRVDEKQRINYPDVQPRIFKNNKQIKWVRPVHEQLEGYMQYATLPPSYYLIHTKTIERQVAQNNLYNTIH